MRNSLRSRIFVVCFATGTGVSVLFGGLSLAILDGLEFEQIDQLLGAELDQLVEQHGLHPDAAPRQGSFTRRSFAPLEDLSALPEAVRHVGPGYHERETPSAEYRVAVADRDGFRYVVELNLALNDTWEDRISGLVILLVVVCSLLGAMLAIALSRRVLEPVTRLAARVSAGLPTGGAEPLATGQRDDEIGRLAHALDESIEQLRAYAAREHEFTGHVSHELRTPLAVTASAVELLLTDPAIGDTARRRLVGAQRSLQSMHEIVEALLALARTEAGTSNEADIDVVRLVDEIVEECRGLAGARSIVVECSAGPPPVVHAFPGALRIVVRNLVANACIHAARGAVRIRLDDDGLTVADEGPGIPGYELGHVHERHFRGARTAGRGDGLGLSIVKRLCARHGWTLSMTSPAGGGTEARLVFSGEPVRPG